MDYLEPLVFLDKLESLGKKRVALGTLYLHIRLGLLKNVKSNPILIHHSELNSPCYADIKKHSYRAKELVYRPNAAKMLVKDHGWLRLRQKYDRAINRVGLSNNFMEFWLFAATKFLPNAPSFAPTSHIVAAIKKLVELKRQSEMVTVISYHSYAKIEVVVATLSEFGFSQVCAEPHRVVIKDWFGEEYEWAKESLVGWSSRHEQTTLIKLDDVLDVLFAHRQARRVDYKKAAVDLFNLLRRYTKENGLIQVDVVSQALHACYGKL